MEQTEFLTRLSDYIRELEGLRDSFVRGRDSLLLGQEDEARVYQIVIELSDFLSDSLGASNRYSGMITNAYEEGVANFYEAPSQDSVSKMIGIAKSCSTRIQSNPGLLDQQESSSDRTILPVQEGKTSTLPMPEKVTMKWLRDHVPMQFWLYLFGLLVTFCAASFALGFGAGTQCTRLSSWIGIDCKVPSP